jgi:hypothetical protein
MSIEIAAAVQSRLAVDNSAAESCQVFATSLETALTNWHRNVERLDGLTSAFVMSVQQTKIESDEMLSERSKLARVSIEQLQHQLQSDMTSAIERQQADLSQLGEQMVSARSISKDLLEQLVALQSRLITNSSLQLQNGNTIQGES